MQQRDNHSKVIGYLLWLFGFLGAHRFYYGKPVTGTMIQWVQLHGLESMASFKALNLVSRWASMTPK